MDNSNKTIKTKAINGMMWSSMGSFAFQIVRILTQVLLARLLWPEAFGLEFHAPLLQLAPALP